MKFNGATFNKAQQDQLKEVIGKELEAVVEKVNDVDARMLNYTGDWAEGNEYHENDVVTWADDGHLYEVIKAHTSSSTIAPSNTEYYKAMTATKYMSVTSDVDNGGFFSEEVKNVLQNRTIYAARIKLIAGNNNPYFFTYVASDNPYIGLFGGDASNISSNEARIYIATIDVSGSRISENRVMVVKFTNNAVTTEIIRAKKITVEYLQ